MKVFATRIPQEAWRRNQYVTTATVFVVFTGFAFVLPFLPLYVRELGVTDEKAVARWAGVLIGVAPLLAGLLAPVWGRLGDRYGAKAMVVRALVAYIILLVLSAFVTQVWQLFVLRVGIGLFGGIGPLGLSMATSLAPREETGRAVGAIQAAQILSAAVGPLAGGFLADLVGIRWTFVATALLCAAALALVLLFYEQAPPRTDGPAEGAPRPLREILALRGVLLLLVVLFLVNFVGRSFTPILPLYLQRLGVGAGSLASSTGLLISVYSIAAALSAALLGRASRRLPAERLLAVSLALGAVLVLAMAFAPSFPALLALAVALGLASGGALTLCYTMGGLMVPASHRSAAFGFFSAAALFGGALAPSVAGLLVSWDLRGIYYLDTAIFVAAALALVPGALRPRDAASAPVR